MRNIMELFDVMNTLYTFVHCVPFVANPIGYALVWETFFASERADTLFGEIRGKIPAEVRARKDSHEGKDSRGKESRTREFVRGKGLSREEDATGGVATGSAQRENALHHAGIWFTDPFDAGVARGTLRTAWKLNRPSHRQMPDG